ncbi:hypothetical protein C8J55DRAFT_557651 [Lentinula edodes]|uniref:Uncharacterized protein n=1 Tax=Lentinula lateritia TaxID=40482 RepID=A0A9W9AUR4_9AGAR|nr:hypothetical protein C8J55DRAFT_557651 [Lentinula edodes]
MQDTCRINSAGNDIGKVNNEDGLGACNKLDSHHIILSDHTRIPAPNARLSGASKRYTQPWVSFQEWLVKNRGWSPDEDISAKATSSEDMSQLVLDWIAESHLTTPAYTLSHHLDTCTPAYQITVASTNRILTRHRTAVLTDTTHSLAELLFFEAELPILRSLDLSHGFNQVPITRSCLSSPISSDSKSDSDFEYYFTEPRPPTEMPNIFSSTLYKTVTYVKWKPCGNGMLGTMSCGKITVETLESKHDLPHKHKSASSDYSLH